MNGSQTGEEQDRPVGRLASNVGHGEGAREFRQVGQGSSPSAVELQGHSNVILCGKIILGSMLFS